MEYQLAFFSTSCYSPFLGINVFRELHFFLQHQDRTAPVSVIMLTRILRIQITFYFNHT